MPSTNKEIWRKIRGYEGLYEVSDMGRVKSLPNDKHKKSIVLKPEVSSNGYERVFLYKNKIQKRMSLHRLVAITFQPNPKNKSQVNHKNGIKADNRVNNLEWCTHSENQKHSYRVLKNKTSLVWLGKFGRDNPKSIKIIQLTKGRKRIKVWDSMSDAGRRGFTISGISKCCSGNRRVHKGFIWEYKK
jgi:hypothetical protein